jgi:hypothetical protein
MLRLFALYDARNLRPRGWTSRLRPSLFAGQRP